MHVAAVPRVVHGTERPLECTAETEVDRAAAPVGLNRHEGVVVVAHGLEDGHASQPVIRSTQHVLHQPHGIDAVRREDHIAQRHAVARRILLGGGTPYVGHRLAAEAAQLAFVLTLRIGHAEQAEILLGAAIERRQRKVIARAVVVQTRVERRITRRDIDGILRRQRIEYQLGIVVSLQTVTATAVRRAASEAVAHDNALYGAPLTVRDHAADLILRAGGTDNSATRHQHQRQQRQKQKTFHSPKMFKLFQKKCDCDTSRREDSKNGVDFQVTDAPAGQ